MQRTPAFLLLIAGALVASCGEPATGSQPRTTPRAAPRAALRVSPRPRPEPLRLSDAVAACVQRMEKAGAAFSAGLRRIVQSHKRPALADALAVLDGVREAQRANVSAYQRLPKPTTATGRQLVKLLRSYNALNARQLAAFPDMIKILYDDRATRRQRLKRFLAAAKSFDEADRAVRMALYQTLCSHIKARGVGEGEERFKVCLKDTRTWVLKALAIKKAACACKRVQCAQRHQQVLNSYIRDTRGVKVDHQEAQQVAYAVLGAQTCISRLLQAHKRKQPPSRP